MKKNWFSIAVRRSTQKYRTRLYRGDAKDRMKRNAPVALSPLPALLMAKMIEQNVSDHIYISHSISWHSKTHDQCHEWRMLSFLGEAIAALCNVGTPFMIIVLSISSITRTTSFYKSSYVKWKFVYIIFKMFAWIKSIVSFLFLANLKQLLLYNQQFGHLEHVKTCPWCTFFLFFCQRIISKTSFKRNTTSVIGWEIETVVKYFTFVMTTLCRASVCSSQTTAVKIKQKREREREKKPERRNRKKIYTCFGVVVIL
jgi:hypothetical protein